jgi:hypothetical protein
LAQSILTELTAVPSKELMLHEIESEHRVLDTDLAQRLEMMHPTNIQGIIEQNRDELERFGTVHAMAVPFVTVNRTTKATSAYYLNKEQALVICMLCRTEKADRVEVIKVFTAYRQGLPVPAATTAIPTFSHPAEAARAWLTRSNSANRSNTGSSKRFPGQVLRHHR